MLLVKGPVLNTYLKKSYSLFFIRLW